MYRIPSCFRPCNRTITSVSQLAWRSSPSASISPPPPNLPSAQPPTALPPPTFADLFDDDLLNEIYTPDIPLPQPPEEIKPQSTRMRDSAFYGPDDEAAYARQLALEEETVHNAVERFRKMKVDAASRGDVATHRVANDLLLAWYNPLVLAIRAAQYEAAGATTTTTSTDIADCPNAGSHQGAKGASKSTTRARSNSTKRRRSAHSRKKLSEANRILIGLPAEAMSVIVVHTMLSALMREPHGIPLPRLATLVASAVRAEANMKRLLELQREHEEMHLAEEMTLAEARAAGERRKVEVDNERGATGLNSYNSPKATLDRVKRSASSLVSAVNYVTSAVDDEEGKWSVTEQVLLGSKLIELFMSVAKVQDANDDFVPAISHTLRFRKSSMQKVGTLQFTDDAFEMLKRESPDLAEYVSPKQQPMVVQPRPWTSPSDGAYLRCRAYLVRRTPGSHREVEKLLLAADLSELFEGLNALGEQAWKVNPNVLDTAQNMWERGGGIAGLVTKTNCDVPDKAKFLAEEMAMFERRKADGDLLGPLDDDDDEYVGEDAFDEKRALKKLRGERRRAQKLNRELVSMRADTDHRMRQAERFAGEERIWLPHNVDFRGRAYPIPVHLQHMGCDLTRALLTFASPGVPLGKRGVYWLKVHLANLLGGDKLSFEERIAMADDNLNRAIDAGRDPMSERNLEWWSTVEDPFQLLAACGEIADAVGRYGGERAMEGFHSCIPISMDGSCNGLQHYAALGRDVEGGTQVNLVPNDRPQDVYTGIAKLVSQKVEKMAEEGDPLGVLLEGKVSRKVVKQTVMTSVYGVTPIGARQQIMNRLAEIDGIGEDKIFKASSKLARLTLSSLGDIFEGATETMEWLYEAAQRISQSGHKVQWTTPVGLPVMQPYRRSDRKVVKTLMQRVTLNRSGEHTPVSTTRQRSAFPPNFVHSIDSAHMLMTAVGCRRAGMNFAAVHDSFWTNAAHVDGMNRILREEFISLHERDLLRELRESFRLRYDGVAFDEVPRRGSLELAVVRDSPYFFS